MDSDFLKTRQVHPLLSYGERPRKKNMPLTVGILLNVLTAVVLANGEKNMTQNKKSKWTKDLEKKMEFVRKTALKLQRRGQIMKEQEKRD